MPSTRKSSIILELRPKVQHEFFLFSFQLYLFNKGEDGECLSVTSHRSAPGGSGAGGSVVIITKTLHGNPQGRIFVQGGAPVKCAFGAGGGKSTFIYRVHFTLLNSSVNDDVRVRKTATWTMMMLTKTITTNIKITTTKTTTTDNGGDNTLCTPSVPTRYFLH